MQIERIDHLVLTVADVEQTIAFYAEVLGMKAVSSGAGRRALGFGDQKINLHQVGREIDPKAAHPTPGSADLCLITRAAPGEIGDWLRASGVPIEEGPVTRTGARGPITSFYFRDPDRNLIEVATYRTLDEVHAWRDEVLKGSATSEEQPGRGTAIRTQPAARESAG
jgi:catechol 2,3-dioxygenase-like lactoylglutathione lyase family enzyme